MNRELRQPNLSSGKQTQVDQPPRWRSIQAGPALAVFLYALLIGTAALALWVREFPGVLAPGLEKAAPFVFLVFVGCFAAYRLALVSARKYPAFKAFFQIAAATLFFMLLLPSARRPYGQADDALAELLQDRNPKVRALAAEVARHRPDAPKYGSLLVRSLQDPDRHVRDEAHRSLVEIAGTDLGGPDSPTAVKAWEDRFR
jgi:HEAT repeats